MYYELRNDYFWGPAIENVIVCPENGDILAAVTIDGWKTAQDDEIGTVVANVILTIKGDIVVDFHDNSARMDAEVCTCINEAKASLKEVWRKATTHACVGANNPDIDLQLEVLNRDGYCAAANIIETMRNTISRGVEYQYMKSFVHKNGLDTPICREQFRSLWTAYCLHHDLAVDTSGYDNDLLELWNFMIKFDYPVFNWWNDFDDFDYFMCANLV